MSLAAGHLIPAISPPLHDSLFDAHRKRRHGLIRRRTQRFAADDGESRTVTWARDFRTRDDAAGENSAVVRAHVLDCVVFAIDVEYCYLRVVHIDGTPRSGRQFFCRRNVDPIGHLSRARPSQATESAP